MQARSIQRVVGYESEGYFFPAKVLSEEEIAAYRARFDELESKLDGIPQPVRQPHLRLRWAYDLATHPTVLDFVEQVVGPEIIIHSTIIFYKTADSPGYVSWHQDGLYPPMRTPALTSAWIALSESNSDNGCMRVIPRSHLDGILPHVELAEAKNLLSNGQTIQGVDERRAVEVALRPGEMSLHHVNLIHGSRASRSKQKRIGFVIRYATPALVSLDHPVVQARGRADCSHLTLLADPPRDR